MTDGGVQQRSVKPLAFALSMRRRFSVKSPRRPSVMETRKAVTRPQARAVGVASEQHTRLGIGDVSGAIEEVRVFAALVHTLVCLKLVLPCRHAA